MCVWFPPILRLDRFLTGVIKEYEDISIAKVFAYCFEDLCTLGALAVDTFIDTII